MPSYILQALSVLAVLAPTPGGQAPGRGRITDIEVKAKLIASIASYVSWPPTGQNSTRPFSILVLGVSPFERHLERATADRVIQGRKIQVQYARFLNASILGQVDLLFVCESESERLGEIIRACKGRPIFTLGDAPDFAVRGIMLNLIFIDNQVRPEVNLRMAKQSGIEISSVFLSKARAQIVDTP